MHACHNIYNTTHIKHMHAKMPGMSNINTCMAYITHMMPYISTCRDVKHKCMHAIHNAFQTHMMVYISTCMPNINTYMHA